MIEDHALIVEIFLRLILQRNISRFSLENHFQHCQMTDCLLQIELTFAKKKKWDNNESSFSRTCLIVLIK